MKNGHCIDEACWTHWFRVMSNGLVHLDNIGWGSDLMPCSTKPLPKCFRSLSSTTVLIHWKYDISCKNLIWSRYLQAFGMSSRQPHIMLNGINVNIDFINLSWGIHPLQMCFGYSRLCKPTDIGVCQCSDCTLSQMCYLKVLEAQVMHTHVSKLVHYHFR